MENPDPRPPARWLVVVLAVSLVVVAWLANEWADRERAAAQPSLTSGQPGFSAQSLVDPQGQCTLPDMLRRTGEFATMQPPQAGELNRCVWYRLRIVNDTDSPRHAVLGSSHEFLQEAECYAVDAAGAVTEQRTGSTVLWNDRSVPGNRPVFAITLAPKRSNLFYLRIVDSVKQPRDFVLWNDAQTYEPLRRLYELQYTGYFALWLGLLAYNGFLFAVLRRTDYFRYLIYLLCVGALALTCSDLTTLVVAWPHFALRAIIITVLINLTTFSLLRFSQAFLDTRERFPALDRWLERLGWLALALSLAAPGWLWPQIAYRYEAVDFAVNIVVLGLLPGMGIVLGLRRAPQAWLYVLAFLPSVAGFIYVLRDNVGLPDARTNGLPVLCANALELVFLALALAWRYRRLTDDARRVSLEYTIRLEENVAARTRELRESNELLARASRDKDRVFAIIGHDLRGPANLLHTLADAMSDPLHPLPASELVSLAEGIKEACESQLVLLDNLLQWGRIQAGEAPTRSEPQAVTEVVFIATGTLSHLARTKGVALSTDIPAALMLSAVPQAAQTVVRNLVGNALKFTPPGGSINVTARRSDQMVEISVRDSGVGMTPERITELLAGPVTSAPGTQSEKGAGIGLTLCRDLARASGGDLQIASELGQGTTVHLLLPLAL